MMRFIGKLLAAIVLAGTPAIAVAQDMAGPPPDIAAAIRRIGPKVDPMETAKIYKAALDAQPKDGVTRRLDVAYGEDERNKLDVYLPEKPAAAMPVVVFVHGGGFIRGDKSDRDNVGYFLARNGMVGLVPSYRLGPKNRWPAGAEDIAAVARWAAANAAALGGDPKKVFLVGESAGAAHVAAAVLMKRFGGGNPLPVAGAMLVSGVYDVELERMAARQFNMPTPEPRNAAYFGTDASQYPAMATLRHIDAAPLPVQITYAELDPAQMQVQAGALFVNLCTTFGTCPELAVIPNHGHISQVVSINTGDMSLARVILGFVGGAK